MWRIKFRKLANALALAHSAKFKWKMHWGLIPEGQTHNWITSFLNGWSSHENKGWISEIVGYSESDPFADSEFGGLYNRKDDNN